MNFDHWKDVQKPVAGPATQTAAVTSRRADARRSKAHDPKSARSIPIDRAYTRVPSGSRKGPAKSEVFFTSAPVSGNAGAPAQELAPGTKARHFVASDPAPDMDLAFADIDGEIA